MSDPDHDTSPDAKRLAQLIEEQPLDLAFQYSAEMLAVAVALEALYDQPISTPQPNE